MACSVRCNSQHFDTSWSAFGCPSRGYTYPGIDRPAFDPPDQDRCTPRTGSRKWPARAAAWASAGVRSSGDRHRRDAWLSGSPAFLMAAAAAEQPIRSDRRTDAGTIGLCASGLLEMRMSGLLQTCRRANRASLHRPSHHAAAFLHATHTLRSRIPKRTFTKLPFNGCVKAKGEGNGSFPVTRTIGVRR